MRKLAVAAALIGLSAFTTPTGASADATSIFVADDPAGDWDRSDNVIGPDGAPVGSALGQDLIEASVTPDYDAGIMNFVISVTELPAIGGTPEATRYTWNMMVGNKPAELDGKFLNYTRGTCDPTAGTCPPVRDPGPAPFVLRGNCTLTELPVVLSLTLCQELAKVEASFDVEAATITIPIPISAFDLLNAGECPEITSGTGIFGGFLSAAPSAFLTSGHMPMDIMEDFFFNSIPTCAPAV